MVRSLPHRVLQQISQTWADCLVTYRSHKNLEHVEALLYEAMRFSGFELENSLERSPFWSEFSLIHRAAVVLFLVDRGVVERTIRKGRRVYLAAPDAECRVVEEIGGSPYLLPTLELIAAIRAHSAGCARPRRSL
jgi:hypothetical protein